MLTSKEILLQIRKNKVSFRNLGVDRIGLFGSYARGDQTENSDMDFLISFIPGEEKYRNLFRLHEKLSQLFGVEVEVVTMGSLSPHIGPYILKEVKFVETT